MFRFPGCPAALGLAALGLAALGLALGAATPARSQTPTPTAAPAPARQQTRGDTLPLHEMRARTFHATHYALRLRVDQVRQTLAGTVTIDLTPFADDFRTLTLDADGLTIADVTRAGRTAPLPFQVSDGHLDITLDRPYHAAEPLTVTVRYQAVKPKRGAWFIAAHPKSHTPRVLWTQGESEDTHAWFPCYDFPNDRATSEIWATVDADDLTISNGALVGQEKNADGTRTDHWVESTPHSTYLTSLIAGPYEKVTDHLGSLEVSYYGYRGDSDRLRRSFGMTPDIIAFYQTALGVPYPYEKYSQTVVPDFIAGGMENISATTQSDNVLHGPGGEPDHESESLAAHELAHQWFGDLVTCRDWSNIWLNEGFATYFASLYTEHAHGEAAFQAEMRQQQASYRREDADRWRHPMVEMRYDTPEDLFTGHSYDKGASVLHMLRFVLGDAAFFRSLHRYLTDHAGGNVDTEDLRRAAEAETGQSLGWFFDEWAAEGGFPAFQVSHVYDDTAHTVSVTVAQTQTEDAATATPAVYRMPVEIGLLSDLGMTTTRLQITGREQTFVLPAASRPRAVLLDPAGWLLKTVSDDNGRDAQIAVLARAPAVPARLTAAEALGRLPDDPAAEAALASALAADAFPGVRAACAAALGGMTTPGAEAALLRASRAEADVPVRGAVLSGLGHFTDAPARAIVREALADPHYAIQSAAIRASVRQKSPDFPRLQAILTTASSDRAYDRVRSAALDALLVPANPGALREALAYLAPAQPDSLRYVAASSLGTLGLGRPEVTAHLTALLGETPPVRFLRRIALDALKTRGDARAVPALRRLASAPDTDAATRQSVTDVADALQAGGTPEGRVTTLEREVKTLTTQNTEMKARLDALAPPARPTLRAAPKPAP